MKKLIKIVAILAILAVSFVVSGFTNAEKTKVVVLMYHGIVNSESRKNTYVITPNELEKDIQYLLQNGYEIMTTSDLLAGVKGKRRIKKTAVLTFDDGFYGNYKYGIPLFEKYNISAVFAVVGCYASNKKLTDKNSIFAYMDWEDIQKASKTVEIASHTYDMHELKGRRGVAQNKTESVSVYKKAIMQDFSKNDKLIAKYVKKPITFAYPYGIYNTYSEQVLQELGYKITLTCNEGINYIQTEQDLRLLKRFNRDGKVSSAEFMKLHKI